MGLGDKGLPPHDEDAEPKQMRMAYKCAQCGETNQVAPPKGFSLARTDEAFKFNKQSEAQALAQTVKRLRHTLEAKEGRMVAQNKKVSSVLKENIRLRAENAAFKRAIEAKKVLREARIPASILSVADLLSYEPHQWASQIKTTVRSMREAAARDKALLNGSKPGVGGGVSNGKGGEVKPGEEAISTFNESYKRNASR